MARTCDNGEFSFVNPLARGGGALTASIGGVVALADELTASARVGILTVVTGLGILAWRRPTPRAVQWALATARTQWRRHLIGGPASVTAYAMVLTATRLAPLGYVATLRETSVVLGAIAGWLLLGERVGPSQVIASATVATGLTLLVTAQ